METMSTAVATFKKEPAPKLYDWQKGHVAKLERAIREFNSAMDGSDTGTGKTIMALEVSKRLGLCPIIICPKAVVPAWEYEMGRMRIPRGFARNYEKIRSGDEPFLKRRGKRMECKGDKSLNSKMLSAAKDQGIATLMLSATACANPKEMKSIGHVLDMHKGKDWWNWCLRNGCRRGRFGGLDFNNSDRVLKKFHKHIYEDGRGSRIRVADLPEGSFPETVISATGYEMQDPFLLNNIYMQMHDSLSALEEKRANDEENPLTIQLRARQQAELFKVPTFADLTKDAINEGNSVVIFVNFRATLDELCSRMSPWLGSGKISVIQGDQTNDQRAEAIEAFQENTTKVCICITAAGGTGLSLHDEHGDHPRVALISPSFSAIELRQVLGRVHRAGGRTLSVQNIVFANGTVESSVCDAVRKKLNNLDLVNDDDLTPIL
jgi:hypothetical protein